LGISLKEEAGRKFQPQVSHPLNNDTDLSFLGTSFHLGDAYDVTTHINQEDMTGIKNWIRGAGKQSDWVVYGVHCHESGNYGEYHGGHRISPPDHLIEFAHQAIDEGCDVFFAHGPHALRGIEIYKGKPIFYSLGNFIFQNEAVQWVPEPAYSGQSLGLDATPGDWGHERSGGGKYGFAGDLVHYRSAVCTVDFSGGKLKEIKIYPIDMGFQKVIAQRGRPVLAEGESAQWSLERLKEASKVFGTEIKIEGDVGYVRF
jgi:poly-gamma-glutamate synthesis protein (capsule biosynthesis protein)